MCINLALVINGQVCECRLFQSILSRLDKSHFGVLLPGHTSGLLLAAAVMQRRSFSPEFLNNALSQIIAEGSTQEVSLLFRAGNHWALCNTVFQTLWIKQCQALLCDGGAFFSRLKNRLKVLYRLLSMIGILCSVPEARQQSQHKVCERRF